MRKEYKYKCQFSSKNDLTGDISRYCICIKAHSIKEAMKTLRGLGFHLGKDFIYWKLCMSDYHIC